MHRQVFCEAMKAKEAILTQRDCYDICPICGWAGPDDSFGYCHAEDCPYIAVDHLILDDEELQDLRKTPWRGTETESILPNGKRIPLP